MADYVGPGAAGVVELNDGSSAGGTISGAVTPGPSGRDRRRYRDDDLNVIGRYRAPIHDTAKTLGVSETAIAGCIAEELDDSRGLTDWPIVGPIVDGEVRRWKRSQLEGKTHDDIAASYEAWERKLAEDPQAGTPDSRFGGLYRIFDVWRTKQEFPATLDVGPGKVRLHTAIRMLREYNERYPDSDPLGIKKYNTAYDKLALDLDTAGSPATAAFVGLMVQEATGWFESKIPDRWAAMAQEDRDVLIVAYYNLGRERIRANYDEDMRRDGVYTPEPAIPETAIDTTRVSFGGNSIRSSCIADRDC